MFLAVDAGTDLPSIDQDLILRGQNIQRNCLAGRAVGIHFIQTAGHRDGVALCHPAFQLLKGDQLVVIVKPVLAADTHCRLHQHHDIVGFQVITG